jgi:hypothetical protein
VSLPWRLTRGWLIRFKMAPLDKAAFMHPTLNPFVTMDVQIRHSTNTAVLFARACGLVDGSGRRPAHPNGYEWILF